MVTSLGVPVGRSVHETARKIELVWRALLIELELVLMLEHSDDPKNLAANRGVELGNDPPS